MQDMAYKELAILKNTTNDAVKSWGRQARKKLRCPAIRKLFIKD